MANESTQLSVIISLQDELSGKMGGIESSLNRLSSTGKRAFSDLQSAGKYLAIGIGAAATAFGVLGKAAVDQAGEIEQDAVAFKNIIGNAEEAHKALYAVSEFARKTPFTMPEVMESAKQLLAFGVSAEDIIPKITLMGDAASKMGVPMQQAIDVWNQAKNGMFNERMYAPLGIGREQLEKFGVAFSDAGQIVDRSKLGPTIEKIWGSSGTVGMMAEQAKTFNGVLSNLKDDMIRIGAGIMGISLDPATFGDVIANSPFDRIKTAAEGLMGWLDAHSQDITTFIQNVFNSLSNFANQVGTVMGPIIEYIKEFVNNLSDENKKALIIGMLTAVGIALLAFIGPTLIAFGEIILVMAAVAAVVALLYTAWNSNFLGIKTATLAVISGIVNFWNDYLIPFWDTFQKVYLPTLQKVWESVWNNIKMTFQIIWAAIKGVAEIGWALVSGIIKVGIDIFTGNWKKAWDDIKKMFEGVWNGIKDFFVGIWDAIKGTVANGINGMIDKINGMIDQLNKIKMPDWAPGIGGKGISISHLNHVALETGTNYVPQDMMALLHKGEAVVPKKYNQGGGGIGGSIVNITGDNYFSGESDEDRLIDKIRMVLSREQERATWGIS